MELMNQKSGKILKLINLILMIKTKIRILFQMLNNLKNNKILKPLLMTLMTVAMQYLVIQIGVLQIQYFIKLLKLLCQKEMVIVPKVTE